MTPTIIRINVNGDDELDGDWLSNALIFVEKFKKN